MPHRRLAIITAMLTLIITAAALAAGPLHGKTYSTATPSFGFNERHIRTHLHAGTMTLKVSRNGKDVTVHFKSTRPVLYCLTTEALSYQTTKAARISSNGSFKATVGEKLRPKAGPPSIMQIVTGTFSGGTVHGTIHTEAEPCGGTTNYTAKT